MNCGFIARTSFAFSCVTCENVRVMRGDRDTAGDKPELLARLDLLEMRIRSHLKYDPRAAQSYYRNVCLKGALEEVAKARAAFSRRPTGARLALHAMQAQLYADAPDVEAAHLRLRAERDGTAAKNTKRQVKAEQLHAQIREAAKGFGRRDLSAAAKARQLAGRPEFSSLTERTIRRILTQ